MKILKLKNNIKNEDVQSIVKQYLSYSCKISQRLLKSFVITDIKKRQVLYKCTNAELNFEYAGRVCVTTNKIFEEGNVTTRKRYTLDVSDKSGQINQTAKICVPLSTNTQIDLWEIAQFDKENSTLEDIELSQDELKVYKDNSIFEKYAEKKAVKLALAEFEENFTDILLISSRLLWKELSNECMCLDVVEGKYKFGKEKFPFAVNMNSGAIEIVEPETITIKKPNLLLYGSFILALIILYIIVGR